MNNPQLQKELDAFSTTVKEWRRGYKWLVRSVVAVRAGGSEMILHGRASLRTTVAKDDLKDFLVETNSVVAARETIQATDAIENMLRDLSEGALLVRGVRYTLPLSISGNMYSLSAWHSPFFHPSFRGGPRLPTVLISTAPKHMLYYVVGSQEMLDWELRAADEPYSSLDQLCRSLDFDARDAATIELMAEYPGLLAEHSRLTDTKAEIYVDIAPGLDRASFKVGVIGYKTGRSPLRTCVTGTQALWIDRPESSEGCFSVELRDYQTVTAFLSYKGTAIHDRSIQNSNNSANTRQAAYSAVDDELSMLRTYLVGAGKRPEKELEFAITIVLHLTGFSSVQLGAIKELQNFSDVLAFGSTGRLVLVECTTGPLDANGKLSKLAHRGYRIRERLLEVGAGESELLPMIVTTLPRGAVSGDLAKASELGIAVLTKEELASLAGRVSFDLDPDREFEVFKSLIPPGRQHDV